MKHHIPLFIGTLLLAACAQTNTNTIGNGSTPLTTGGGMMDDNRGGMMQGSFLPGRDKNINQLPEAKPMSILEVEDGDTITLNPELVRASINGKNFALYAYNGQFPGPLLKVTQGSTFTVNVQNNIDVPTTIHWHGIRLENKFDGAAGVTQEAIDPGQSFTYSVKVPDEGMFWYHPHVREDLQQDMGLYGGLWVTPKEATAYRQVDNEEVIMLDDMLLEGGLPVPYGEKEADHALMGRFGNVLLLNGQFSDAGAALDPPGFQTTAGTTRFYFTNAANTRTFNIQIVAVGDEQDPLQMRLVGGDAGRLEREMMAESFVLSPSERVIAEVYLPDPGRRYQIMNVTPAGVQLLGLIATTGSASSISPPALQTHRDVEEDIAEFRPFFDKPIDKTIHLSVESMMAGMMMQGNQGGMQHGGMMHGGTSAESGDGIEWEDPMPHMNAMSTKGNTQWRLIDEASAQENMDIVYNFKVGDKVKIRLVNDEESDGSDHPMQHPIHFHGQRFLVLAVDGKQNENLVWKDTVLVEKGQSVDILLDVTNPGDWMFHCHIAEHLSNGMMGVFKVSSR